MILISLLKSITNIALVRINKKLHRLFWVTSLFILSVLVGILGFMFVEGWTLVESFYMTVITIGTVGFAEVHPLSEAGRVFTSFFIIFNLGVFALFASVVTSYLFEGELRDVLSNYITTRKVQKLNQHVIICGFGKNGHKATEEFIKNGTPFVVIERDPTLIQEVLQKYASNRNISYIEGDATQDEVLKAAGVERAKALITTLPKDADSVFVSLSARQLNPNLHIIARANEASAESKLLRAGADKLVRPDLIGGIYMANLVNRPRVIDFLDMISGTGELKLEEFSYEEFKEDFRGKSIIDLNVRKNTGAHIMGFKDKDKGFIVNPHPSTHIDEGDIIILLGTVKQIEDFAHYYTDKKVNPL